MGPVMPLLMAAGSAAGAAGAAGMTAFGMSAATLSTIGAVSGLAGGVMEGIQAKRTGDYNAAMARREGQIQKQKYEFQAQQERTHGRLVRGNNFARASAGGGSLDVIANNTAERELNILNIEQSGLLAVQSAEAESDLYKAQGRDGLASGILGGVQSGMTAMSKIKKPGIKKSDINWNTPRTNILIDH